MNLEFAEMATLAGEPQLDACLWSPSLALGSQMRGLFLWVLELQTHVGPHVCLYSKHFILDSLVRKYS